MDRFGAVDYVDVRLSKALRVGKEAQMRRMSSVTLGAGIVIFVIACGGGGGATLVPGATLAPGATTAPGTTAAPAGPTTAPVGGDVSQLCAGMPTFNPEASPLTLAQDETLNARFPTEIAGQPVTGVRSYNFVQGQCYYGASAKSFQSLAQFFSPALLAQISQGAATATLDDQDVFITAFRTPGADPNQLFAHLPEFLTAIGIEQADIEKYKVEPGTIAGKSVYVVTDADGDKSYSLVSGDAAFTVGDVTEEQAGTVLSAFQ